MKKGKIRSKGRIGILFTLLFTMMFFIQSETMFAQTNEDLDDPEYWRANGYISDDFYENVSGSGEYDISLANVNEQKIVRLGVDVSKYQQNINWAQAKAQGVEFALIRVGYRGSGSGTLNEDSYFRQNIEGALAQGIPVGVYFFSQAVTEAEAIEEAYYTLERIKGYHISLPVVIDYEFAGSQGEGRLYNANLSKEEMTGICRAFCATVENAGYKGMVYANRSMLRDNMYAEQIAKDYCIWMAHYTSTTDYKGEYDFWQYTSKGDGYTYGMQSQYVDLNYWYDDGSIYTSVYKGVDYEAVFNPTYYAEKYPDVKDACGGNRARLLAHFVDWGMTGGRQGKAEFDVHAYKNRYEDLRAEFGEDLRSYYLHYINCGLSEGRIATPEENTNTGVTTNPNPETNQGSSNDNTVKPDNSESNITGLKNENGNWVYYENGVKNTKKYGFVLFGGSKFLVAGGKVALEVSGLAQDPENPSVWYYLSNGQAQTQYTGLVEYDGAWFYVNQGQLDTTKSGYTEYNGGLFYIGAGRILKEASGLSQDPNQAKWYYLAEGQAQTQYTGLTQYDGSWFYVVNGTLAEDYTGSVEYDGAVFQVVNGSLVL